MPIQLKMGRIAEWYPVPVKSLERKIYGRLKTAYRNRHSDQTLLVHVKPFGRNHQCHDSIGLWALIIGTELIRRKFYCFKCINEPPTSWANKIVRLHRSGVFAEEKSRRQAVAVASVWELPDDLPTPSGLRCVVDYCRAAERDELPSKLRRGRAWRRVANRSFGPESQTAQGCSADTGDRLPIEVDIPLRLPIAPRQRTINGAFARVLLSRDEQELFTQFWMEWIADHPDYATEPRRSHLNQICMEHVLMYRLLLLGDLVAFDRLYNASFNREMRARDALGASRRHRIEGTKDHPPTSIAVLAGMVPDDLYIRGANMPTPTTE